MTASIGASGAAGHAAGWGAQRRADIDGHDVHPHELRQPRTPSPSRPQPGDRPQPDAEPAGQPGEPVRGRRVLGAVGPRGSRSPLLAWLSDCGPRAFVVARCDEVQMYSARSVACRPRKALLSRSQLGRGLCRNDRHTWERFWQMHRTCVRSLPPIPAPIGALSGFPLTLRPLGGGPVSQAATRRRPGPGSGGHPGALGGGVGQFSPRVQEKGCTVPLSYRPNPGGRLIAPGRPFFPLPRVKPRIILRTCSNCFRSSLTSRTWVPEPRAMR